MKIKNINDYNFYTKIFASNLFVVILFYAPWCQPSKKINQIMLDIHNDYKNKIQFFKTDVTKNYITINKYNIVNIPTLIVYKKNQIIHKTSFGSINKNKIINFLNTGI